MPGCTKFSTSIFHEMYSRLICAHSAGLLECQEHAQELLEYSSTAAPLVHVEYQVDVLFMNILCDLRLLSDSSPSFLYFGRDAGDVTHSNFSGTRKYAITPILVLWCSRGAIFSCVIWYLSDPSPYSHAYHDAYSPWVQFPRYGTRTRVVTGLDFRSKTKMITQPSPTISVKMA